MSLKMFPKIKLIRIRKYAKESLYKDYSGRIKNKRSVFLCLYLIPSFITILLLFNGILVEKDFANFLATGISIFAGLFFGLLFIVNEKYNSRKQILSEDVNEETINYLKRYKIFASQLVSQISYTICISIALIILNSIILLFYNIEISMSILIFKKYDLIEIVNWSLLYTINGILFYLSAQFIYFILVILSSTYVMLIDDLDFEQN